MQIGDIVYIEKLTEHVKFIIKEIYQSTAIISAIDYRLILDTPLKELMFLDLLLKKVNNPLQFHVY